MMISMRIVKHFILIGLEIVQSWLHSDESLNRNLWAKQHISGLAFR